MALHTMPSLLLQHPWLMNNIQLYKGYEIGEFNRVFWRIKENSGEFSAVFLGKKALDHFKIEYPEDNNGE